MQSPSAGGSVAQGSASGPLQLTPERLRQDWRTAHLRARAYARALGVEEKEAEALAGQAVDEAACRPSWPAGSHALRETLAALRRLVLARETSAEERGADEDAAFLAWRLRAWAPPDAKPGAGLPAMPEVVRAPMIPQRIERHLVRRLFAPFARLFGRGSRRPPRPRRPWKWTARRRRLLLAVLVLIPSVIASNFMVQVLPERGRTPLEIVIVIFFGALFGWVSIGLWTALLGAGLLARRGDRFRVTRSADEDAPIDPECRTAIVMPICQEPVDRVFAGLRAIHRSLEQAGGLAHFDFFVLSDSSEPDTCVAEEEAWARWCRDVGGYGRIFYRRRRVRLKRKSGNVADFCRRWGRRYRYMICLDADSVMSGQALMSLVRIMERNPDAAIVQTAPVAMGRRSLFGRVQQFSSGLYGPMFAAGLHFWQLGDGQYWGHNAIIRVAPFMDCCSLAPLPGRPPFGGEILSHDFVEAALLGRGGWTLWLAYDLPGSWEETPSSLLDEMKRDRRWCQGNLQHLRLFFSEGFHGSHRALFLNGVMSYVSALLWFCFLTASSAEAVLAAVREPDYFPTGRSLFPEWPVWRRDWALALLAVTGILLFLPKVVGVLSAAIQRRRRRAWGGLPRLALSALLEVLVSSLLAPVRMVFHTRFVITNLVGRTVTWRSQEREDRETSWGVALRHHGLDTVVASAWGLGVYSLNPGYFWWLMPIVAALILSVPLSVFTSRVSLGDWTRARRLFLTPEEHEPPPELRDLREYLRAAEAAAPPAVLAEGFVRAAVDPKVNALHVALGRGPRSLSPKISARREALLARALAEGPQGLDRHDRRLLLSDADTMSALHDRIWEIEDAEPARRWRLQAFRGGTATARA
jgi:membrane glycosyltransferase